MSIPLLKGTSGNLKQFDSSTPLEVPGDLYLLTGHELRFYDVDGSNYVGFEAPSLSANRIWVLPAADGSSGQALITNGSGTLSWAAPVPAAHASTHITGGGDTIALATVGSVAGLLPGFVATTDRGKYLHINASADTLEWVIISGTGDVVGPASATNNAIARFDTTTGKLIQDTPGVTIDDSGNLSLSTNGSSFASPRTIGFSDLSSGEAGRVQFGDSANGWQNGFGQAMQMWAYHSIIVMGDRSSGTPPSFETTSNIGLIVRNTTAGSVALVVDGATSQTANLQQWRNSSGTVLAHVDTSGNVTLNAQADIRLADSDSSHYVGFQAPATISANVVWTLPAADGTSGQLLRTNGSGTLTWVTPALVNADYTIPFASCDQTDLDFEPNDLVYATAWMPVANQTITTIKCCVVQTATGDVYAAVYDASLSKLRDETTGASCSTVGVKTLTLSSPLDVTAGTTYYICFRCNANGSRFLGTTCTSANFGSQCPAFIDNNAGASSFPSTIVIDNRVTRAAWAQMN